MGNEKCEKCLTEFVSGIGVSESEEYPDLKKSVLVTWKCLH